MLLSPLYKLFKNAANPQKLFRKHFIAAALGGFVASYAGTGLIVYNIYKAEREQHEDFKVRDVLSWNLIKNHGLKGLTAAGLSYAGDASLIYSLAGIAYWRNRKKPKEGTPPPPEKINIPRV